MLYKQVILSRISHSRGDLLVTKKEKGERKELECVAIESNILKSRLLEKEGFLKCKERIGRN